jgi:hypothetical protein
MNHETRIAGQFDAALNQRAGDVLKRSTDQPRRPVGRRSVHDGNDLSGLAARGVAG